MLLFELFKCSLTHLCFFLLLAKHSQISMDDFANSDVGVCVNYPMVHHITDATVVEINKPGGDHLESRAYFSGKHKLYCLKVEGSVYPNGEACDWTVPVPGATADISIFRGNIKFHKRSTKNRQLLWQLLIMVKDVIDIQDAMASFLIKNTLG